MRKLFAQTLAGSVLLIHQHRGCVRKQTLLSFFQMSKSTGNFLTLTQAVDKFSADGECILTCIWLSIMPKRLKWAFCSLRSLLEYWMAINLPLTTCSCRKAGRLGCVLAHLVQPGAAPGAEPCRSSLLDLCSLQRPEHRTHCWCAGGVCTFVPCMPMCALLFPCPCVWGRGCAALLVSVPRRAVFLSRGSAFLGASLLPRQFVGWLCLS